MPNVGPTIVAKKPVAKVEPLDTKKGSKGGIEDNQQKEEQPTIICVDLSEEDGDEVETMEIAKECEQDIGPAGEPDNTEIYRTAEGKKNHLGEVNGRMRNILIISILGDSTRGSDYFGAEIAPYFRFDLFPNGHCLCGAGGKDKTQSAKKGKGKAEKGTGKNEQTNGSQQSKSTTKTIITKWDGKWRGEKGRKWKYLIYSNFN